jgi:ribose transport system ATP-binding protein
METVLKLKNVSKTYPGVRALDSVNLDCLAGEVHAILGENGSGKSTLMKIASGVVVPETGTIEIGGKPLHNADARLASELGLATVYQDDSLVLELTVAQNLFLATPRSRLPYSAMRRSAKEQLSALSVEISPDAILSELTPAQRQFVEIVKALQSKPKVLLLDEPTATLDVDGVQKLATMVRKLTARGTGVIYVTHRLPEILELANRITILRDGVQQGTFPVTEDLSEHDLVSLMVGRDIGSEYPEKPGIHADEPVLRVEGLDGEEFHDINFEAHAGEILGIAGAEGNGQREMLRAIVGLEEATGHVSCRGTLFDRKSPRTALSSGVLFLSSDRKGEAIFPELSVQKNMVASFLRRFLHAGILSSPAETKYAEEMKRDFGVVAASLNVAVGSLSGGNQQKSVLARSFRTGAKAIIIDEPTQGVDAGARYEIYKAIRDNIADDRTCIVNSSDALELAGICDRVLVVSRGRIVHELSGDELTEETIVSSFMRVKDVRQVNRAEERAGFAGMMPKAFDTLANGSAIWWVPLLFLLGLTIAVSVYAAMASPVFLKAINLRHTLLALAPAGLVAMAQLNVLLVRGIDVSVGALMSLTVVAASFIVPTGSAGPLVVLGALCCLAVGGAVGLTNGLLIRLGGINAVITTIAMLSIVQGFALIGRPIPGGAISPDFTAFLKDRIGFLPYSTFFLIVLALIGDYWLHHTRSGLEVKATGFREEAARRNGVRVNFVYLRAYVLSGAMAAMAGLFLASQVGIGHPTVAANYALASIAAAVLGGAALTGGRGSFGGALFGALFFTLMINVISLIGFSSAVGVIASGIMTLTAVFLYSGLHELGEMIKPIFTQRSPRRSFRSEQNG